MNHKVHFASEQEKAIAGLLTFVSEDETRPGLCGIHLEVRPKQGVVRAVACNGHVLGTLELCAPIEVEVSHDLFIPWNVFGTTKRQAGTALKKFFKGSMGTPTVLTYTYDTKRKQPTEYTLCNTANATQISWKVEPNPDKFPDWRRILPNIQADVGVPTEAVGYNLNLMAPYYNARYGANSQGGTFVPTISTDETGATIFVDFEDQSFLGLVMPLRMPQTGKEMRESIVSKLSALRADS